MIAQGRQAPSFALADALRQKAGPCPICEPLEHEPEWASFASTHGPAIVEELRVKAEAEAAEAKRKAEEEEAARKKRIADLEAERARREAAPLVRLAESDVRRLADEAVKTSAGDAARFQTTFRALVRDASPAYAGPLAVHASPALRVMVLGPIARFEAAIADRLERRQPTAGVAWMADVAVVVTPVRADAPDIRQVVVERTDDANTVGAEQRATVLSTTLAPRRLAGSATGAPFVHAGEVVFPLAAFEPGASASVRVIAVPASGAPFSRTFASLALRAIQ
jgi:hypothetical protein